MSNSKTAGRNGKRISSIVDFNTNHKILFPFQRLSLRVGTSDNKSKMSDFLLHLNKAYKIPSIVWTICLVYLTNMSLVDTFHVAETVHLHKYGPPLRFPPTVNKCDTMKRNRYLYKQVSFCHFLSASSMNNTWHAH